MILRPAVLLAIAWRDLSAQLRGRRGWVLPVISLLLLGPLAAVRMPALGAGGPARVAVSGDVPEAVAGLPDVVVQDDGGIRFTASEGTLTVHTRGLPPSVRDALDGPDPELPVEVVAPEPPPLPGRTLLLALLASSLLTGSVAESLPGERGRGTLEALLTAAVTREEIVGGKWLAWAGYGVLAVLLACVAAAFAGTVPWGPWLLAAPTVPMATVALGLFLVRRARDVVGGATVSLRVLPAVLSILGILAWAVGLVSPVLGAALPIGGALVAAGGTWEGWLPVIVATASTLALTGVLLALTGRTLEQAEPASEARAPGAWRPAGWMVLVGIGAGYAPLAWGPGGNPTLAASLPILPSAWAMTLGLVVILASTAGRATDPWAPFRPRGDVPAGNSAAIRTLVGAAAGLLTGAALGPTLTHIRVPAARLALPDEVDLRADLMLGLPTLDTIGGLAGLIPVTLLVVTQELAFRGLLRHHGGPILASVAFILAVAPADPLRGAVIGLVAGALTALSRGHLLPAIVFRLVLLASAALVGGIAG